MSESQSLPSYLESFDQIKAIFDAQLIEECREKYHETPTYLYRYLCHESDDWHSLRQKLNELLQFSQRNGFLDNQTLGRIRSLDDETFLSGVGELECAKLFHDHEFRVTPRPNGRGNTTGDFEVSSSPPIFVEVKSLFDRSRHRRQRDAVGKLWEYSRRATQGLDYPCLIMFGVVRNRGPFRGRVFASRLRRELMENHGARESSFEYVDSSGFSIDITLRPVPSLKKPSMVGPFTGWWGEDSDLVYQSLRSSLRQLPDDGRGSLVIVRSWLSFPPDAEDVKRAARRCFSRRDSRLGGIGLVTARTTRGGYDLNLEIYPNPNARVSLPMHELERAFADIALSEPST